ncbi:MAG: hypothetical protein AVDCRST_MAG76-1557 [uncultured Acidimicrobiales bacterium]|uniref:DUF3090 domain-containing protein n=1 Tax=uncultured Acidimicrobiales bacterium TaxID=310071 RepID=A0A6J4HXI1_9ACTN|nr:MAG: hypothetical protein AVDCRST_MAG76-1557 [uncultured Acidimicrobiales bacterium]
MSSSFDLSSVDRITVGTVGQPGSRTFFLQAREGSLLVSLKVEKGQVAALAERLGELLHENPASSQIPEPADLDLEEPTLADFVVGSLGLSFSSDEDRVVIVCEEMVSVDLDEDDLDDDDEDDEDAPHGAVARFGCTRGQAAALAMRGATLVATGRAACPLCGYPLDPRGHVCPKTNGHRPPRL